MAMCVRSIDIGNHSVKIVVKVVDDILKCISFSSNAVVINDNTLFDTEYSVMISEANGRHFACGDDAYLLTDLVNARPRHDDYVHTDEYVALSKSALRLMDIDTIDVLVLGLPVRLFHSKRDTLKSDWRGRIDLGNGKSVYVKNVVVVVQPFGAYRLAKEKKKIMGRTLVIDPGWQTIDWLLIESGRPLIDSTDSVNMGCFGIMQRISQALSRSRTQELPFPSNASWNLIDEWVRTGVIELFGGNIKTPIDPYMASANDYVRKAIQCVYTSVQEHERIEQIVIAGGGAIFYEAEVRRAFPHIDIFIPDDPVYANVQGFQLIGQDAIENTINKRKQP